MGNERKIKVEVKGPERTTIQVAVGKNAKAEISIPAGKRETTRETTRRGVERDKVKRADEAKGVDKKKGDKGKSAKGKGAKKNKLENTSVKTTRSESEGSKNSKSNKKSIKTSKAVKGRKVTNKGGGKKKKESRGKLLGVILAAFLVLAGIVGVAYYRWQKGPDKEIEVGFSKETGLYTETVELELKTNAPLLSPLTEIRYTLDGDDPAVAGETYTGKLTLEMETDIVRVYPVKVAYCYMGGKCGTVYENTYILSAEPEKQITLEIISITSDHKNLYDYETGIMVPGKTYDENMANREDGGEDKDAYVNGNYNNREVEWIRDADIVMLDTEKQVQWDQEIGIQISGNTSSSEPVKSLKLVANEKYGYNKLRYDFETSGKSTAGLSVPSKYNSLRIRAGGQDRLTGNIRSSVASRLAEESGFDGYSATERAVVYLNGEFYGIFDVQQNYSDSFIRKRFGLSNADLVEKHKGIESEIFGEVGISRLFDSDLDVKANRERLEAEVDMDNYLTYYALEILWNNTDWPQNSLEIWRYNGENDTKNKYADGRWRFLIYDTDMIYYRAGNKEYFEGAVGDTLTAIMENRYRGAESSFRKVVESDYYRQKFLKIVEGLLNGTFETDNVIKVIDKEAAKIEPAMKLYYSAAEVEEWKGWIALMKQAVREWRTQLIDDLYKYFKVVIY